MKKIWLAFSLAVLTFTSTWASTPSQCGGVHMTREEQVQASLGEHLREVKKLRNQMNQAKSNRDRNQRNYAFIQELNSLIDHVLKSANDLGFEMSQKNESPERIEQALEQTAYPILDKAFEMIRLPTEQLQALVTIRRQRMVPLPKSNHNPIGFVWHANPSQPTQKIAPVLTETRNSYENAYGREDVPDDLSPASASRPIGFIQTSSNQARPASKASPSIGFVQPEFKDDPFTLKLSVDPRSGDLVLTRVPLR